MEDLEKALRERPDDLGSWIVYGDWLLEQHDARGELIHLEQRFAKARAEEKPALRGEIDALTTQHRDTWNATLPAGVVGQAWKFGFVTKVSVIWSDDAPAAIASALELPFVTGLRIVAPPRDSDDDGGDIDDDGNPIPPTPIALEGFEAIDASRLAELDVSYVSLCEDGAKTIAANPTLAVTTLDLRYCHLGDTGLAAIADAPFAAGVRRLFVQTNQITHAGVRALHRFVALTELDLRYNVIALGGVEMLLAAPFTPSLTRLWLNRGDVMWTAGSALLARSERLPPALRSYWRSV
jgi:uncharacterized protein (TIGR02996 family)